MGLPIGKVNPKEFTLSGAFKNRWTSFLESTFILWIASYKRRFFSPKEKSGGNPRRVTAEVFHEMRDLREGFHR